MLRANGGCEETEQPSHLPDGPNSGTPLGGVMRQSVKIQHELVNNTNDKVSPLLNEPVGILPQNEPSQIRSEANELVSCGLRN